MSWQGISDAMSRLVLVLALLLIGACGGAIKPYNGPPEYGHFNHQH